MKHIRLILLALLIPTIFAASSFAFDFAEIEQQVIEHKLDNGLTFIILPRHDAPVVSFVTHVNVGCSDDPMGSMGMAHMFEHMAFKGTRQIGSTDIKKESKWMEEEDRIFQLILDERAKGPLADSIRLAGLEEQLAAATDSALQYVVTNQFSQIAGREGGVGLNAGTSMDYTAYYISYPSNKLELWMAMESDRFANPVLRELFKEKQVVAEERRFRITSSPSGKLFWGEYIGLAYNAHPYGKSLIGEMSEIQNYNRPVMEHQFDKYYVPRNIAIGVVGDIDPDEVIRMAEKYFGRLKDRPAPRALMIDEEDPFGTRTSILHEKAQPMFITGYHMPSIKHPDFVALDALAGYLGSGRTSVLYKNLVKGQQSAVDVSAFVGFPGRKYPTLFSIFCVPSNDFTNTQNEEVILAEIEKVRTELIPEEELDKIKAQAKAAFINGLGSNSGMASQLAAHHFYMGGWREMFKELERVNALTTEDIKRVANKYLDPEKRVVAYLEKPEEEENN